jgi:type IV secretion system protein VirB5
VRRLIAGYSPSRRCRRRGSLPDRRRQTRCPPRQFAGTQQALGEAAYTSNAQRTTDLGRISTIGTANDPKAIAEINARITAQQALIANESTRLQALSYMQQLEQQQNEQRAREVISTWSTYVMPPISF